MGGEGAPCPSSDAPSPIAGLPDCEIHSQALQNYAPLTSPSVLMSMSSACPLSPALPSHACISILHFSFLFPPFPLSVPAPYPAHVRRPPNLGSPPLAHLLLNRPCDALIPSLPPDVVRSDAPACAFASHAWHNYPPRPLAIRPHIHVKRLPSYLCLAIPRTHIHPSPVLPLPALCYCTPSRPFPTPPLPQHFDTLRLRTSSLTGLATSVSLPGLPTLSGSILQLVRFIPTPCKTILPAPRLPSSYPSQAPFL